MRAYINNRTVKRLIDTKTLEIVEFGPSTPVPEYAILSHTWGNGEATFNEWSSRVMRFRKRRTPGFAKVLATCKQARRDGFRYVWVDTVCMDRTEVSVAINSMFSWYKEAYICYVYLADVPSQPPSGVGVLEMMGRSRWFKRGWTLQELIAPQHAVFYSQSWTCLGTKRVLASFLSSVTGIDLECILHEKALQEYSIAQRMSWAADRSTSRPEDIAYCLLGLFEINIPLIYGEGNKAFIRIQEEIIRTSNDHSLLAFDTGHFRDLLLASHPGMFRGLKNLRSTLSSRITPPFSMTNAGLSIQTPLIRTLSPYFVIAVLNCVEMEPRKGKLKNHMCLPLIGKDGTYIRLHDPVSLIRRGLCEATRPGDCKEMDDRKEIEDLTTTVETKYLVSSASKVPLVFKSKLERAGLSYHQTTRMRPGFMLTFPRGMGSYRLVEAYPPGALHRETSHFSPPAAVETGQSFAHGLLVFQDMETSDTAGDGRIGVYVAHTLDSSVADWGGQWMCVLTPVPDGADLYERCKRSWPFEENPNLWGHYDHMAKYITAARTSWVRHYNSGLRTVMVEVVFDADVLALEQELI